MVTVNWRLIYMSGHSKWSTIKRQKGVADAKRGQAFTKLANAITLAVKAGGGITDPNSNFKLRLAIDKARSVNMPKDNIDRAVERGAGKIGGSANFDEVVYEGFGPSGVVFIIEAATDNKNRTTSEVKNLIEKNGGTLGTPGSVSYMFERRGELTIKPDGKSTDELLSIALESGARDLIEDGGEATIVTTSEDLQTVRNNIENTGVEIERVEMVYAPKNLVEVDESTQERVLHFLNVIEDHEDVQNVYTNLA